MTRARRERRFCPRSRSHFRLAAVVVAIAAACLLAGAAARHWNVARAAPAIAAAQAPAKKDGSKPWLAFDHNPHVHGDWLEQGETDRDCQGCHRYTKPEGNPDPQQFCEGCHFNATRDSRKAITQHPPIPIAALERAEMSRFLETFRHSDHLVDRAKNPLECKTCHHPNKNPFAVASPAGRVGIPNRMNVPQGIEWCIGCHDSTRARPPVTSEPEMEPFVKRLNQAPGLGPAGDARFAHDDHLRDKDFDSAEKCDGCHASIRKAEHADFAAKEFRFTAAGQAGCGKCHIRSEVRDQAYAPVAFKIEAETKDVWSLAKKTFSHAQHLSEKARAKSTKELDGAQSIKEQVCLACHAKQQDSATSRFDFPRADGRFKSYQESCAGRCHFHKQKENWYPIDDHGEVDNCSGCHDFDALRDPAAGITMKTNRPQAAVARSYGDRFVVYSQSHPYIAQGKLNLAEIDRQCGECHKAGLADLPSHLNERAFRHATHLPASPSANDCAPCHGGIERTTGSLEIERTFPGKRLFKEDACIACHTKGVQALAGAAPAVAAKVSDFPHAKHLSEAAVMDGRRLECATCHALNPPTPADSDGMTTIAAAKSCAQCHDHKEHASITGKKDSRYVADCARCHVNGVPPKGEPVLVERVAIRGIDAHQYHPSSSVEERAILAKTRGDATPDAEPFCIGCHQTARLTPAGLLDPRHDKAEPRLPLAQDSEEVRPLAEDSTEVRTAYAKLEYTKGAFHASYDYRYGVQAQDTCYRCHWNDLSDGNYRPPRKNIAVVRREHGAITPDEGYPGPDK